MRQPTISVLVGKLGSVRGFGVMKDRFHLRPLAPLSRGRIDRLGEIAPSFDAADIELAGLNGNEKGPVSRRGPSCFQ